MCILLPAAALSLIAWAVLIGWRESMTVGWLIAAYIIAGTVPVVSSVIAQAIYPDRRREESSGRRTPTSV